MDSLLEAVTQTSRGMATLMQLHRAAQLHCQMSQLLLVPQQTPFLYLQCPHLETRLPADIGWLMDAEALIKPGKLTCAMCVANWDTKPTSAINAGPSQPSGLSPARESLLLTST